MKLGLIGTKLSHSFSKKYFEQKFEKLNLSDHSYSLFELKSIQDLPFFLEENKGLTGFNVTFPFKESILSFLDEIDAEANKLGAVNTVSISWKKNTPHLTGSNTDVFGFKNSIKPFLENSHERALILGTGGAAKAVNHVLQSLGITTLSVSRTPKEDEISYCEINEYVIKFHKLIINCTPLGTFPNVNDKPELPYHLLNESHTLMDLVYNPETTEFMRMAKQEGAVAINGLSMLKQQAEKAWEIWNK
jgi:shikimate dehydrogenase